MKAIAKVRVEQLIVDEAAMIKEPETLVPIIICRPERVVLIGDHKQLRCIVKCHQAADLKFDQSLFERYCKNLTMLEEQYRMHPSICKFPSNVFYSKKLVTSRADGFKTPINWPMSFKDKTEFERMLNKGGKGYNEDEFKSYRCVFLDVKGIESKLSVSSNLGGEKSVRNEAEIKCVEQLYHLLIHNQIENKEIKILSPYRSQVAGISTLLKSYEGNVSTVITSQGGEWDYVILSTVRTLPRHEINEKPTIGWRKKYLGFLCDENQINVAITRARRGLLIIGSFYVL